MRKLKFSYPKLRQTHELFSFLFFKISSNDTFSSLFDLKEVIYMCINTKKRNKDFAIIKRR